MMHPLGIRVDSPWRVWLFVLVVTGSTLFAALAISTLLFLFYGSKTAPLVYFIAGFVPLLIVPPVTYVLARIAYKLTSTQEELLRLVNTDDLTGLHNRRAFFEQGRRLIRESQQQGKSLGLLVLDADNFKSVNDNFGHMAGDEALRYLAYSLQDCANEGDLLARFGGDEFAVLRLDGTRTDMDSLAAAIHTYLTTNPFAYGNRPFPLSMSTGTADTSVAQSFDMLLSATDVALYEGKRVERMRPINGNHGPAITTSHASAARDQRPPQSATQLPTGVDTPHAESRWYQSGADVPS